MNNIEIDYMYIGREQKKTHWKLLTHRGCRERVRESNREVNLSKVQCVHRWDTMVKPLWTMNTLLNNKGQKWKTGPVGTGYLVGGEEGEWRRWRRVNMVNVLYKLVWK
jgi:hypothetical protein